MTATTDLLDRSAHAGPYARDVSSARTVPIDLLQAFVVFARERGWAVDEALIGAGISPSLLAHGRSRVTEEQFTAVVQDLWRQTDDEMFGLGAHRLPRGSIRLLCYGALGAKDLGDALDRFQGLMRAMPALPALRVEHGGRAVRVSLVPPATVAADLESSVPLMVCAGLAVLHRLAAWAVGGQLPLAAVEVPYPRQFEETHGLVFAAPVVYDAQLPAIVFDVARLRTPVVRSESELDAFIAGSPAGLLARPAAATTIADQVRRMCERAVRSGRPAQLPTGDEVAAQLAISPQTLRRRLADEGTSLRRIRDEVLRDEAVTSLVNSAEPITSMAVRLGFSEPSALTRAFRRWTGNPPSAYRAGADG